MRGLPALDNPRLAPWMRGRCWDMAVALGELTQLPLHGLFDDRGDCHHAFVMTADGRGIDWCGIQPIAQLAKGCKGQIVRAITTVDVAKWVGRELSRAEIREAKKACGVTPRIQASIQIARSCAPTPSEEDGTQAPAPRC